MDYIDGGDLMHKLLEKDHFSISESKTMMYQLLLLADYLHCHGIIHRDLKPQNILLVKNTSSDPSNIQIKVTDFGLSQIVDKETKLYR